MHGKCPKCNQLVSTLKADPVDATAATGTYKAFTLSCPKCGYVLGAQVDPIFIGNQILKAIKRG
jgi:hypothetical protein